MKSNHKIIVTVHDATEVEADTLLLLFTKALGEHGIEFRGGPKMANASMAQVHKILREMSNSVFVELTKAK